jgi:hypothetical protein
MSRKYTNRLLEMIEEGALDKDNVILACVLYMPENDVQDMMEHNEMIAPDALEEEKCQMK